MSQDITITAAALTLDPGQQKTKIDLTYDQTIPDSTGPTPHNDIPCQLEVSLTGADFSWVPLPGANSFNARHGSAQVSTVYGVFQAGQQVYLRAVGNGLGDTYGQSAGQSTGNIVSNTFDAGFAPAA